MRSKRLKLQWKNTFLRFVYQPIVETLLFLILFKYQLVYYSLSHHKQSNHTIQAQQSRGWKWQVMPKNIEYKGATYRWISRTGWWHWRRCVMNCPQQVLWGKRISSLVRVNVRYLTLGINCIIWLMRFGGVMRRNKTKMSILWIDILGKWFYFSFINTILIHHL